MTANRAFEVVAITIALGGLGTASAASAHSRNHVHGFVLPCSLDGVNPVYHPSIFGDPAVAASYGFVRSRDGTWHVEPNCRR